MKLLARIGFIASLLAACCLPAFASESADAETRLHQGYNIGYCTASADGIGKVIATYQFYYDNETQANLVSQIIHVRYELAAGYFAAVQKRRDSISIRIFGSPGALFASKRCNL